VNCSSAHCTKAVLVAFILLVCQACDSSTPDPQREISPSSNEMTTMQPTLEETVASTDDARTRTMAARRAAQGDDPREHASLRRFLVDPAFVHSLDSAADYEEPPTRLRIAGVIKDLMENRIAESDATLNVLASDDWFVSVEPRQYLMILAMVEVRPASKQGIALWTTHSNPDAAYRHTTLDAIPDNATEPAMPLLERIMTDPAQDPDERVAWMRDGILRNRDKLPILAACDRMLKGALEPALKLKLVAALFDHQDSWYVACDIPVPPSISSMSREVQLELRSIGEYSIQTFELDPRTKAAVEANLKLLAER